MKTVFIKRYKNYTSFYFELPAEAMEFEYFRNICFTIAMTSLKYRILEQRLTTMLVKDKRVLELSSDFILKAGPEYHNRYAYELILPYRK